MNYLDEILSEITSTIIKRKIKTELIELIDNGIVNYDGQINIDTEENGYYKIGFYNSNDNNYYDYIISTSYPISPPKLNINCKPYSTYFRFNEPSYTNLLLKYAKIRCFCCETITCGYNWGPQLSILSLIKEVEKFRNISKEISYRIIIDVIKRKYLNDDINIIQWLY